MSIKFLLTIMQTLSRVISLGSLNEEDLYILPE